MAATSGIENAAISVLKSAVEHDNNKRFTSALACYQEGIQLLMNVLKECKDSSRKQHYRSKVTQYMDRAELVKTAIQKEKDAGTFHEQIHIQAGSKGNSYNRLFTKFLDELVSKVEIEDAYIRNTHQVYNLLRFCELLLQNCPNLKVVELTTGSEENPQELEGQKKRLSQLAESLGSYNVQMITRFSPTLHDREIRLDNGWVIKIGRGLDYFRPTEHKFAIGFCDYDLRPCHETTIDIFHRNNLRKN